jgi:protein sidekick
MEHYPQNVTVLDGKDATIYCKAVGAPTPNITWIYNGKYNFHCVHPIITN